VKRKNIDSFGRKGKRGYVRVFREPVGKRELVRVQWREGGQLMTESFENSRNCIAEAKAFAEGKHDALVEARTPADVAASKHEPLTLRQLRDKYFAAHANLWEPTTLAGKTARWKLIELALGRSTLAADVTCEQLDEAVTALVTTPVRRKHKKRSVNQVKMIIETLTSAYRWAVDQRGLLAPTRVVTYRAKLGGTLKKQVIKTAEYSADERAGLIAALDPRDATQWRAWALNTVLAFCGPRASAALFLELPDIDLEPVRWIDGQPAFGGRIHWREDTDKMDTERFQPMPSPVAEAFWIALGWRAFDGYTGRFIFYGAQRRTRGQAFRRDPHRAKQKESMEGIVVDEKPYTYSSLNRAMRMAEDRAGIEHIHYRSTHGHRRGVSGDIHAKTGSSKKAAEWIGDRSTAVVEAHYILSRESTLTEASEIVTAAVATADGLRAQPNTNRNKTKRGTPKDAPSTPQPSKECLPT
jgi:integrase